MQTTVVQDRRSWGYITYAMDGHAPNPSRDHLYVATGEPGLKVYRVSDLLNHQNAKPLGEVNFVGAQGVVSAPLVLERDPVGQDRVVISIIPDHIRLVSNLTGGKPQEFEVVIPGWNSGTALQVDDGNRRFMVAAGKGVYSFQAVFHPASGLNYLAQQWYQRMGDQSLSQLVRETIDGIPTASAFASESNGRLYKIGVGSGEVASSFLQLPGFNNTGPASDDENVYFGLRWEGSTSASSAGSDHGVLIAMNKEYWTPAWIVRLPTTGTDRSWVNVSPIVWQSPQDPNQRMVIVGDAGGAVSAYTDQGEEGRLFLTHNLDPIDCDDVESTNPSYIPDFSHTHRTLLTRDPFKVSKSSSDVWWNVQGVATEMTIWGSRLFTGYNHSSKVLGPEADQSSLVIFRPAANLSVGELRVERTEDGSTIGEDDPVRKGEKLKVTVPITYQGDPLKGPVTLPLAFGFSNAAPQVVDVTIEPFATVEKVFEVTVPGGQADLLAVVNPSLYAARHGVEVGRDLPPDVTEAPPALPGSWTSLAQQPIGRGEVWALDNARSRSLTAKAVDDAFISQILLPEGENYGDFSIQVGTYYRSNQEKGPARVTLRLTAEYQGGTLDETITYTIDPNGSHRPSFTFEAMPPGQVRLKARLIYEDDTDPTNNYAEATLTVTVPEKNSTPGVGSGLDG